MNYADWVKTVPAAITDDPLWTVEAYRLALFASDLAWHDATKLVRDRRTLSLSDQLYRSVGSISANAAEGYSRGTGKDRAHFYEYALGSARESRDWYYKAREAWRKRTAHRMVLCQVIRLLLTMVPQQRGYGVGEENPGYKTSKACEGTTSAENRKEFEELLSNVPLP